VSSCRHCRHYFVLRHFESTFRNSAPVQCSFLAWGPCGISKSKAFWGPFWPLRDIFENILTHTRHPWPLGVIEKLNEQANPRGHATRPRKRIFVRPFSDTFSPHSHPCTHFGIEQKREPNQLINTNTTCVAVSSHLWRGIDLASIVNWSMSLIDENAKFNFRPSFKTK